MKNKLCIFAGTTEGRQLASLLRDAADLTVCVATEYGEVLLDGMEGITVLTGRMDEADMERLFAAQRFERVIDATHPYATAVTENIAAAAEQTGTPVMRILRETQRQIRRAVYVASAEEACAFLAQREGSVLLTTGAKELAAFALPDMQRVWARVLPTHDSLRACDAAGIPASHVIAAQGPFSFDLNVAQLRMIGARYMVTKASGKNGGFDEKIAAADAAGVVPVVIGQPPQTQGFSMDEAVAALEAVYALRKRKIYVIGAGPGGGKLLTDEAKDALAEGDAVLGAKSVTDLLTVPNKPVFHEYLPQKVLETLNAHPSVRRAAVVMRGDTGFFSGAKKLAEALQGEDLTLLPGISSAAVLAARIRTSWDDAAFLSLHGRDANLIRTVARSRKTFALAGTDHTPQDILRKLCAYGFGDLRAVVGERLSYPDERITRGTPQSLQNGAYDPLSVLYFENENVENSCRIGIPDDTFIRGDVPMTKAEVRAVSLAKLAPQTDSVVWDVGAGTGSVAVECALIAWNGQVYAVEKEADAAALIRQNKLKFRTDNLNVVEGAAPEALSELPAPTHVFIGGSGGKLCEIVGLILEKNPQAVIVVNAVTLETQTQAAALEKQFGFDLFETVSVQIARSRKAGAYHMMQAQNPVYVFSMRRGKTI